MQVQEGHWHWGVGQGLRGKGPGQGVGRDLPVSRLSWARDGLLVASRQLCVGQGEVW